jgi:hypothetical protein
MRGRQNQALMIRRIARSGETTEADKQAGSLRSSNDKKSGGNDGKRAVQQRAGIS